MKIGELVLKSGLTERMLRHYETLGIIVPERSAKGTRHYSDTHLLVARLALDARALDIPLETIAAIAKERRGHPTGDSSSRAIADMLTGLAESLAEKAEKSLILRREIVEASKAVRACYGCKNAPSPRTCPECPMTEATRTNAIAAMIWRND